MTMARSTSQKNGSLNFAQERNPKSVIVRSVLRDDFGPDSDVDVLVEFKAGTRVGLIRLTSLEFELGEIIGRKVDLNTPGFISRYFRPKSWQKGSSVCRGIMTPSLFYTCLAMRGKPLTLIAGKDPESLAKERMLELALIRLVEIIGEAAGRVSQAGQEKYTEIPWREVIGMRNRLIHGYDSVDFAVLWDTIELDLPLLISQLEKSCENRSVTL